MLETINSWIQKATFFDWLTNITGIAAAISLLLLVIGFRRYIFRKREAPIDYIGTGIWILATVQALRLIFWDLSPDILGSTWNERFNIRGSHVNWIFNAAICIGVYFKLRGYHLIVEEKEPGRYLIYTAVFYPHRLKLMIVSRTHPKPPGIAK